MRATQKLKVIYKPEGGSAREWVVDLVNPAWDITYATEKATGWPWAVLRDRLGQESAVAFQALLWTLRKRDEPKLTLDSVRPEMSELDFAAQCPQCEEWVSTEDEDAEGDDIHVCSGPAESPQEDEPDPEA